METYPDIQSIFNLARQIKGFIDPEEGRALYAAAREVPIGGPGLEVGSYCGKSALYLGAGCREQGRVLFSVDHHRGSEEHQPGEEYFDGALFDRECGRVDTFPEFRANLARSGLEQWVVPLVCPSTVAARQWATPLAFVFIDGGHALETAQSDYLAWAPHILPGGYLLIHDIFPDPAQGGQAPYQIYRSAISSRQFKPLKMIKSLGILERRSR
ncbi:MAG: class I SAM-dependent methyltransferase [Desulfobacterales bacterium]|jgi:predicted O-methyltransferase YrrM